MQLAACLRHRDPHRRTKTGLSGVDEQLLGSGFYLRFGCSSDVSGHVAPSENSVGLKTTGCSLTPAVGVETGADRRKMMEGGSEKKTP